ncbi:endopeptidase La [Longimicrobium terrae]|uniref:Lon protease n=1 Tax=Longimicrobium terrae TaxID=1639882 RepID=A0A841H051_9BACT|nr:endopeptidase La [Longimicrobium terrae]MBB4636951.1 ATP-dependent Lon protease [Longimicrobium terrae]MBB6071441.1 ATP-dependent Lon protease [Longimicrobium terrae]NNC31340.1 endopeptidase La [Longimicrobium terrae]
MLSSDARTPSQKLGERIPVLPIRSTVVFPSGATALQIGYAPNVEALNAHPGRELIVAIVSTLDESQDIPPRTLEKVATAVRVLERLNLPGGTIQTTLAGLRRIHLEDVRFEDGYYTARARPVEEVALEPEQAEPVVERILTAVTGLASYVDRIPDEVPRILRMNLSDPGRFADLAATLCNLKLPDRDAVLGELNVAARLALVQAALESAWERAREVEAAVQPAEPAAAGAEAPRSAPAKTAELRRRITALQAELGEVDPLEREADEMLRKLEMARLPARVAAVARREAERLRSSSTSVQEASELRTYLEALISIPWNKRAGDGKIQLAAVETAFHEEHLGMDESKQRLLEVLAVAELRGDLRGPVPCIVGPPGVGKRTLATAIARGLGRPLIRLELGGRGEGQLFGTRRTRAGAQMGKLMQAIADCGVKNPVFLLEELDEAGLGNVEGDPVEALEEALDPENREEFTDRYLDVPFDLSEVFFIGSAGDFYRIPRDLRDLFIEIRIAGYTPEEKIVIGRDWLFPRILKDHGLSLEEVTISDETLLFLTRGYARDAGVGNLRRSLAAVMRFIARQKAEGRATEWAITREMIEEVLGYPRWAATMAESKPEVGVVTGLAWTASGGELMFIEALKMPGSGRLVITGLLGDVMRESVNAAYSYVRSRAEELGIPRETFGEYDIHVHFPVGATPKDGPSAGAAVTLAIASSLSDRPVRHDLALTGEVTLRGKILEIGGVKEKVLAAYRAGITNIILPTGNQRDVREVPADVRERMQFFSVERMDQVFSLALLGDAPGVAPLPLHAEGAHPLHPPERQAAGEADR